MTEATFRPNRTAMSCVTILPFIDIQFLSTLTPVTTMLNAVADLRPIHT
jgi:hypothetical protein